MKLLSKIWLGTVATAVAAAMIWTQINLFSVWPWAPVAELGLVAFVVLTIAAAYKATT